uniref:Uncharacterized protein n=1 Tax=Oscillatoriales cyanobacterium SpSt-402 TaxID=2282168 RepID=A0A832H4C1_9CYAN
MKAYKFPAKLTDSGQLELPSDLQQCLREQPSARIIVLIDESEDESAWAEMATEQFLSGYSDADEIYDRW